MMKKTSLYLLWMTLFPALFGSCEWEVDVEDLKTPPRLVLNSVVRVGEPVTASLSRTWFFTEENPNVIIPDAEVSLHVNGQYMETMTWTEGDKENNSQGFYQAAYRPKAGDHVALTANREGYPAVSGEVVMPAFDQTFEAVDQITGQYYGESYYVDRLLSVTFRDNPGEKNYYLFFCEAEHLSQWGGNEGIIKTEWSPLNADYEEEPLFVGQKNALENILGFDYFSGTYGRVFTDDQINGKEYTLRIPFQMSAVDKEYIYDDAWNLIDTITTPHRCRVSLYTISESYYRYMKTLIDMEDSSLQQSLIEAGVAEPISIYCNINQGLGILGASNGYSVTFELSTSVDQ